MTAPKMSEVFELPVKASAFWTKHDAPTTAMEAAVRAINSHDALVEALDEIFMMTSYVVVQTRMSAAMKDVDGPRAIPVTVEEVWLIIKQIGEKSSAALALAEGRS